MGILGVKLQNYSKGEIIDNVDGALQGENAKIFIVTLNPEILLEAEKDEVYRNILNNADLKVIDGFGIKLVSWLKRKKTGDRITGADLAEYILKKASELGLKIGLVIRKDGLSKGNELGIRNRELGIKNATIYEFDLENPDTAVLNKHTEVILVGLGAPWQEKFIWKAKNKLPDLKLAIGVGGTFDYWTGKQKRAPKIMRKMGLEWLWRLIMQPKRFMRIWRATVVFLWKNAF